MKGDIKGFPIEVVQRMVYYQVEQGNKADVEVFQKERNSWTRGFLWADTKEGDDFWDAIITDRDFAKFFRRYTKKSK